MTYKTAFYSFYLPVACGMHLADVATEDSLEVAKKILIKMGQYFQIQDDYLDCFADASVLGKVGTDIQDNKCSWLICQALKCATLAQKTIIAENYGKDDDACVQRIKNVYKCVSDHHFALLQSIRMLAPSIAGNRCELFLHFFSLPALMR